MTLKKGFIMFDELNCWYSSMQLPMLEAFQASLELSQAASSSSVTQLSKSKILS